MNILISLSNKIKMLSVFAILICTISYSQNNKMPAVASFEKDAVLNEYKTTNSSLSTSENHFKFGNKSLQWTWTDEASFGTSNFKFLTQDESPLAYGDHFPASPTLQMAIYNEIPQNGSITVSYEKDDKKEVWFDITLNFKGWRTIWVPFYEMQGNAPKKGAAVDYNYFKISTTSKSGTLFFDDIIFSQYQDDRHQYPDEIVPFIKSNLNLSDDHWMPLISNYNRIKNLEAKPISMAVRLDLKKFEQLIDADLTIAKKYKVYINSLRDMYAELRLNDNGKTVTGPPLTFKREQSYYDKNQQGADKFNDVQSLGKVLKKLANFYDRANLSEKAEIENMFLSGTKYFLDQGWQAGSNGGTRHHIGYNVREITEAFFVMRQLLYNEGLLQEVGSSLHWLFNLGMLLDDESEFHVNIDYLNTQSYYHLMLIFLLESQEKQAALLSAYSKYMSITLAQQNEEWGFKVDGTSWHHNGHYPAYGIGAFQTVPKVIRTLARTRFRLRTEGHENFKKAFLASRIYSQKFDWGFGNAGRHPLEGNGIKSLKEEFLLMAYAGSPDGKSEIDKDVAAAYLRLWGKDDILNTSLFTEVNDINKERLSGFYTFPYAATAVKRDNDWAAIIKGYSKYVWASEIYVASNRYGRYPANGTIQLLNNKGEKGSGFRQEGWDWNRYPGATIIYLPLEELEAKMPLIMFRSNEFFAGTATLDNNGIFGMILNEGKGSNADGPETKVGFPGKLKAKKSVFSFGDKLICIGTGISSIDEKNPTQTNLFQTFLQDNKDPIYIPSKKITKFPIKSELAENAETKNWIIDPYGNAYHMLSNHAINFKKEKQNSYHNKYSVNTGKMNPKGKGVKETEGNYASAWINHGLAPKNSNYQYVIYPFNNEAEINNFSKRIKNDKSYAILRADSVAHIAKDLKRNTTGYVIFEANNNLENGILKTVSKSALIMAKEDGAQKVTLSVVQPDLNFPEYQKGKFRNYSQSVKFTITVNGKWTTSISDKVLAVDNSKDETIISLELKDGMSHEIILMKL
ncbi:chondroitinase family polysaccharide lyase [Wocania ichthyoenteri]|uniref:chondroitinase family polysaccharide lyase n=1 Tax=Wocania ichthyoenteri TaxID=1230531 RepID=UPI0009E05EEB|nr:chondroitinase family polysaccharide lyase [Wocania ichthyoenteri]